jgi:hypothetical protein
MDSIPAQENNGDPREYIRDLAPMGEDMEAKSKAELNRAQAVQELPQYIHDQGEEEIGEANKRRDFIKETNDASEQMYSSAERVAEAEKRGSFSAELGDFANAFNEIHQKFIDNLPFTLAELSEKDTDDYTFRKNVREILEVMDQLKIVGSALQKSRRVMNEFPEILIPLLEPIKKEAKELRSAGKEKLEESMNLEGSDPKRVNKLKEIESNTKRNLEPMQRTIGRNSDELSSGRYGNLGMTVAVDDLENAKKERENAYINKVEERITQNMQEKGKTQEEIKQAVQDAKDRINKAIEDERSKTSSTPTAPSSYTTPVV